LSSTESNAAKTVERGYNMDESKKEEKQAGAEAKYVFPEIPEGNSGAYHVDPEAKVFWLGIKVETLDYAGACAFLESAKYQLYCLYREAIRQMRAAEALMPQNVQMGKRTVLPPNKEQFTAGLRNFLGRKGK
jgi:hypothetical protein